MPRSCVALYVAVISKALAAIVTPATVRVPVYAHVQALQTAAVDYEAGLSRWFPDDCEALGIGTHIERQGSCAAHAEILRGSAYVGDLQGVGRGSSRRPP